MEQEKSQQNVDFLQPHIGDFGKYQLWIFTLMTLPNLSVAHHQMAIVFLAPKNRFTCDGVYKSCPCDQPVYDKSTFTNTITMQWNLICENKWGVGFSQTIFQFGIFVGSVLFGMAADRYGRKNPLLVALVMEVLLGIAAAFATKYWVFSFIRLLIGSSIGGIMVITFVIVMEIIGAKYRDVVSALYHIPFTIGHMTLPLYGYFCRDWQQLQLSFSIPTIVFLSYFFLVPESPRWLITVNRVDEAIAIVEKAAKVNNRPLENIRTDVELYRRSFGDEDHGGYISDLFRTPNLRKNILAASFNWMAGGYCFYGVSQYVGHLSGNVFWNIAASGAVTFLGTFASIPVLIYMDRKSILVLNNSICGICMLMLCFIPDGLLSVVCACIGVVSCFISFVVVYVYSMELFPTIVRNAAMGFSSMMARLGSMVAPFIITLQDIGMWVPPLGFAVVPIIAVFVTFFLPETKGTHLINTIGEGEALGKTSMPAKTVQSSQPPRIDKRETR